MMKTRQVLVSPLVLIVAIAAACTPGAPIGDPRLIETVAPTTQLLPSESTAPPSTDSPLPAATANAPTAASTPTAGAIEPQLLGLPQVELAKAELAGRLGVAPDDIEVALVEPRTWGDTSMGCPDPNMGYLQVPQDGLLVVLAHAGQTYNYHSGGNEAPFLCQQPLVGDKTTPVFGEDILTRPAP